VTTTPKYVSGVQMRTEAVRKDAFSVMARLVEHYRNSSTDRVEGQWREPVASYLDPELWERELAAIHRTVARDDHRGPGSVDCLVAPRTRQSTLPGPR
jgi:hypothetical protein